MRLATSNIRNRPDLPRGIVREAAAQTSQLCDVAFLQEIGEREDHIDVEAGFGPGWAWVGRGLAIPIAFQRKRWYLVDSGHELMHHGRANISPARYVNWAVLRSKNRFGRRGKPVCFMNTHFVSGAWVDKHTLDQDWRQEQWQIHYNAMRRVAMDFVKDGITVVFGGDLNRMKVAKFHSTQRWICDEHIDKLAVISAPRGASVALVTHGRKDVTHVHDHKAVWAELRIS